MMPAKFDLYSAWIDPYFYVWGAVFAAALFALIYSIRRYVELKNLSEHEEVEGLSVQPEPEPGPAQEQAPEPAAAGTAEEPDAEKTLVVPPPFQEEPYGAAAHDGEHAAEHAPEQPAPEPVYETPAPEQPAPGMQDHNRAENFVRGIYAGISDLDERMKGIEAALSKGRVNNDFAVKFLEDVLQDFDALEKEKIRARISYLLSDLKK